jgi:tubulin polyglutamylase TTLL6/13
MCFEILGMDVMIDHKAKVWLLEVNHTPSFTTDTPFDYELKFAVIKDTINLMNFSESDRMKH